MNMRLVIILTACSLNCCYESGYVMYHIPTTTSTRSKLGEVNCIVLAGTITLSSHPSLPASAVTGNKDLCSSISHIYIVYTPPTKINGSPLHPPPHYNSSQIPTSPFPTDSYQSPPPFDKRVNCLTSLPPAVTVINGVLMAAARSLDVWSLTNAVC